MNHPTKEIINILYFSSLSTARQPEPVVEATTVIFQQPEDEVPRARQPEPESIIGNLLRRHWMNVGMNLDYFSAPFSCLHEGNWYREREEFREGPDGCSICLCVNTQVKCNDESCPRDTTTTTTTTTPPPTTTPFIDGPRGESGTGGDRGALGVRGEQVSDI